MALSATVTKVILAAPKAGVPGYLTFDLAFTSTYVNGALDFSSIAGSLLGLQANDVSFIEGVKDGYVIEFARATTPTWANLGTIKAWGGTTEATGTFAKTFRCIAHLIRKPRLI